MGLGAGTEMASSSPAGVVHFPRGRPPPTLPWGAATWQGVSAALWAPVTGAGRAQAPAPPGDGGAGRRPGRRGSGALCRAVPSRPLSRGSHRLPPGGAHAPTRRAPAAHALLLTPWERLAPECVTQKTETFVSMVCVVRGPLRLCPMQQQPLPARPRALRSHA